MILQTQQGHVDVETLAGSATLAVHQHDGAYCVLVGIAVLDPAMVLALATELTRASVPPAPVRPRRVHVFREGDAWSVECPDCPPPFRSETWFGAMWMAHDHLTQWHSKERAA